MTFLEQYWQEINSGKVRVSERFRQEIKSLVSDLNDDLYIYDTAEANKRIKFQETLCKQSKGSYTGIPLKLCLWQKAFWEVIYSFKMADTGIRRFTEVLLLVARKNGKSSMLAGDSQYDLLLGRGVNIACISNNDSQAKMIWDECANMAQQIDPTHALTGKNQTIIYSKQGFNNIFRLTSKMSALDGKNISKCYYDEMHESVSDEVYQSGKRSMSASDEPLMIICTTNGFVRDHILDEKISKAHQIMDGEIEDIHFLPWLYEQDTESEVWQDSTSWEKSNPSLPYGIKKMSFLEAEVDNARVSPTDRVHLLTKDFNISQLGSHVWLNQDDIYYPQEQIDLIKQANDEPKDWIYGFGAVDLSKTTDLTSAMFLYDYNGKLNIIPHYWITTSKLTKSPDISAGAKYLEWADSGYLTVIDEPEVNQQEVAKWFLDLAMEYKLRAIHIGYDRWCSREFVRYAEDYGFTCDAIPQGYYLSNAMYRLHDELEKHNINFCNEKCTAWCLSNVEAKTNELGQIKAVKGINKQARIDGAITAIIAIETYRMFRKDLYVM